MEDPVCPQKHSVCPTDQYSMEGLHLKRSMMCLTICQSLMEAKRLPDDAVLKIHDRLLKTNLAFLFPANLIYDCVDVHVQIIFSNF